VIDPAVDVAADIAAINRGVANREGDRYTVNGRVYGVEQNGRAYPITGSGIFQFRAIAFERGVV
jgi:hypothetical protein